MYEEKYADGILVRVDKLMYKASSARKERARHPWCGCLSFDPGPLSGTRAKRARIQSALTMHRMFCHAPHKNLTVVILYPQPRCYATSAILSCIPCMCGSSLIFAYIGYYVVMDIWHCIQLWKFCKKSYTFWHVINTPTVGTYIITVTNSLLYYRKSVTQRKDSSKSYPYFFSYYCLSTENFPL